jgi:hypothetical protein
MLDHDCLPTDVILGVGEGVGVGVGVGERHHNLDLRSVCIYCTIMES